MSARLPDRFFQRTIDGMWVGSQRYTVPWAMWVGMDGCCWLHPRYSVHKHPGGTVEMLIERTDDGFRVTPPPSERWTPVDRPSYVGSDGLEWIPVAEVVA